MKMVGFEILSFEGLKQHEKIIEQNHHRTMQAASGSTP
jgi:hypothetical protein